MLLVLALASTARADSPVDQYLEQVPNGDGSAYNGGSGDKGGKDSGKDGSSDSGSSSGSSGSTGGNDDSGSGSTGGSGSSKKDNKKRDDKSRSADTAPPASDSASLTPEQTQTRASQPLATESGSSGGGPGIGILLVLLAVLGTAGAAFLFVRRSRFGNDSGGDAS